MLKFQTQRDFLILFDSETNKVLKSEKLPMSGSTVIAETKIRVWAKKNGLEVR